MKKIAFVLKANSLEQDDRVRKEALSLTKLGYEVKIFLNFGDNKVRGGITNYGIPYESVKLVTREKFKSSSMLFLKALDFYFSLNEKLTEYDIIWAHEEYSFVFPLLNFRKRLLLWDLHEFPERFRSFLGKKLLTACEKGSNIIVHANDSRMEKTLSLGLFSNINKHAVLSNYPDRLFISLAEQQSMKPEIERWLDGSSYVYLQGLALKGRYPFNTISALLNSEPASDLKVVVVGNFDGESKDMLENKYGETFSQRVYFTGQIDQLQIPKLVKDAIFTIVLYQSNCINNELCEPNRLYQAINMGVPAITGNNLTMASVMKVENSGVVLDNDGEDIDSIGNAIYDLMKLYDSYKNNTLRNSLLWNDVDVGNTVSRIIESRR